MRIFAVGGYGLALTLVVGCGSPLRLTVEDSLGRAGEKTRLVGKLGYQGLPAFDEGLYEKDLNFFLASGRFLGSDRTNDEGYASIKHRFEKIGVVRFRVTADDHRRRWAEGQGRVFVWEKNDPILIVDIDGTICQTHPWSLVAAEQDTRSVPLPGAPEVLTELAKRFRIVYLTARPREYIPKTIRWLDDHEFPAGPVLSWDLEKHPWAPADYKRKRIDRIQDEFPHARIGIGNTEKDYEAYRKRKLLSLLLDPKNPSRRIDRGIRVPDWNSVAEFFRRNPRLGAKDFDDHRELILP